jgi:hypothetical protein
MIIGRSKWWNNVHLVSYLKDPNDIKSHNKFKMLRKLNTRFSSEQYQSFCWIITDKELAEHLGISTSKKGNLNYIQ